ncbi:hypothetical protein ISS07_01580 [Candidatus Woesearchaeota archaeon]|nr:hypothetical protein [Candidatus Woesearchaeota archaeon]
MNLIAVLDEEMTVEDHLLSQAETDIVLVQRSGKRSFFSRGHDNLIKPEYQVLSFWPLVKRGGYKDASLVEQAQQRYVQSVSEGDVDEGVTSFDDFFNNPSIRLIGEPSISRSVLIYDSVVETGSTMNHCVEELIK